MLLDSLDYNKLSIGRASLKQKIATSPQCEFNFFFKLASPKFIVYCTRNCLITNLSSAVQIPVTGPGNYIS